MEHYSAALLEFETRMVFLPKNTGHHHCPLALGRADERERIEVLDHFSSGHSMLR
jgi:hypothetical protein